MLLCAGMTEKGPVKPINQDAYLVKRAQTPTGDIVLAVVADGMSGLQQGEVASGTLVRAFDSWFQHELPLTGEALGFSGSSFTQALQVQWANLLQEVNLSLMKHGSRSGVSLGTACTVFLAANGCFHVMQVGDTRLGCVRNERFSWLTRDQTFAARELAAGHLTAEELMNHPLRNTLLQCVGASRNLRPVFERGTFDRSALYVLCSDGFCRSLTKQELTLSLNACKTRLEKAQSSTAGALSSSYGNADARCCRQDAHAVSLLRECMRDLVDIIYARGQHDNATVIFIADGGCDKDAASRNGAGAADSDRASAAGLDRTGAASSVNAAGSGRAGAASSGCTGAASSVNAAGSGRAGAASSVNAAGSGRTGAASSVSVDAVSGSVRVAAAEGGESVAGAIAPADAIARKGMRTC